MTTLKLMSPTSRPLSTPVIPAARESTGLGTEELLTNLEASINQFSANVKAKFSREGEW
jgi:hypothetical protein